jgi:hypothetical protein
MKVIWLLVGIIAVTIAFFLPGNSTDLWPSMNAAGIVAVLYILALLIYTLRHPFPIRTRIIAGICSIIFLFCITVTWILSEDQSYYQRNQLLSIKSTIARGIAISEVPTDLIEVLERFHAQGNTKKATLGQMYQQTYPYATVQSNIHRSHELWDSSMVQTLTVLTDTEIVIMAQDRIARGRNPLFENTNGQRGTIQEKFILTAQGVCHESEN